MMDDQDPELSATERTLSQALQQLPPIEPPGDLRQRFRDRAETERFVGPDPRRWVSLALAAALVLSLAGGWWLDRQQRHSELAQVHSALDSALKTLSAATRLQAITVAGHASAADSRVVEALTQALLTDPNTNVRMAAAEALGRVAGPGALAEAATRSIGAESSPFVQTALLTAIVRLPHGDRQRILRGLLSRTDLDPAVRAEAERAQGS